MKSKQIIVSGLVQGVGFRDFTQKTAQHLGIVGWARNLRTNEVEIFAQAKDESVLMDFIDEIKRGPPRSKVEKLEINDVDSLQTTSDTFSIEPDGEKKNEF